MASQSSSPKPLVGNCKDIAKLPSFQEFLEVVKDNKKLFEEANNNPCYNGRFFKFVKNLYHLSCQIDDKLKNGERRIQTMKPIQLRLFINLLWWCTCDGSERDIIKNPGSIRLCAFPVEICSKCHDHQHNERFHHFDRNINYVVMKLCEAIIQTFCCK
jgi:hypothetical protein